MEHTPPPARPHAVSDDAACAPATSHPLTPANPSLLPFDAVPVQPRYDGWTPEKQLAFIDHLAMCGCMTDAAMMVGMSVQSAYALRQRSDAAAFRSAWRIALDHGVERLADAAYHRALRGPTRPVFYRGEQVGEIRHYDERLTMFLLRYRNPAQFGKWRDAVQTLQRPEVQDAQLARAKSTLKASPVPVKHADPAARGLCDLSPFASGQNDAAAE
jgi:hypothetical protein